MRIAFIDPSGWDFNVETPLHHPLGGSHSAACYLAIALAEIGHDVFFITATSQPGNISGVTCLSTHSFTPADMPELKLDAAVLLLSSGPARKIREALGREAKLVFWTGHDVDQKAVESLADSSRRDVFDGFVMCSDWQRERFVATFKLPADRTTTLRYAVAPAFGKLFKPGESIVAAKAKPPVLAYTSTPYRGLDVLLYLFPQIRQRVPGARLRVFSDMRIHMASSEEDQKEYGELYKLCGEIEGVEYVGALPQPQLAKQMREVAMLAYSNTFPETACISVLEAMASGCRIVSSALGALPETTAGFATLVRVDQPPEEYAKQFVDAAVTALQEPDSPAAAEEALSRQVRFIHENYDWNVRAKQWEDWLTQLPAGGHTFAPTSPEQGFPVTKLPRNEEPMNPYFGTFIGLLRRALVNGGSEMGLGLTLFSLAASIRAATIIEIGRFKGFSTLALASALKLADIGWDEPPTHRERPDVDYTTFEGPRRRQLFSIDPFPTAEAKALIEEANLGSYVTLIDKRSEQVSVEGSADLVYIDGEHTYEGCLADVQRFTADNLRAGGYFVLHDYYGWYDGNGKSASPVRAVIEKLIADGQLERLLIDTGYMSFVIFRKRDPKAAASLAKL